jgi:hypothetical protein
VLLPLAGCGLTLTSSPVGIAPQAKPGTAMRPAKKTALPKRITDARIRPEKSVANPKPSLNPMFCQEEMDFRILRSWG